jgi:signal transduction histidine kinase
LTLRTKLSLFLSVVLTVSIGVTGGVMIYESARGSRGQLVVEQQLFAENRAFALRDNLQILESELDRLTLLPQIDLGDENPLPEAQLLEVAHTNSVLYNTAVLLLSANGDCVGAVPDRPEYRTRHFGEVAWFKEAKNGLHRSVFRVTDDPVAGRTVNVVQPIVRKKAFVGALVGVIALNQANVIIPALTGNLPPQTDVMLVDGAGRVIFPTDRVLALPSSGWSEAIAAALHGTAGTMSAEVAGEDSLFAFAPIEAGTGYSVVFRRPWRVLAGHLQRQLVLLVGILLLGSLMAAAAGLLLSVYLTRPLRLLSESAGRIARGQHGSSTRVETLRGDELGELVRDFLRMEEAIVQRDQELREGALLLEQRVEERTRQLHDAQKALVEAERFAAMGKTSAAIAHELKNALNGLGIAVELILEDPANVARASRLRGQVLSEIGRLRDVVDSLSSFSRSPRIDPKREDIGAVVERAVALLSELAADRGVEVTSEVPPRLFLNCDGHKIQGVVMNLVKNAIEASRNVVVRARVEGGDAVLEVADDGPGLSEEARGHLFEPFFTTKPNGTGLGLPTSLRYVQAHGGTIEAGRAADLGGALLRVRLPVRMARAAERGAA